MLPRVAFALITLFWATMNVLLWRAEFRSHRGSPVPLDVVVEKILTAPDASSMAIFHHGKRIGHCHWNTAVGEEWAKVDDSNLPTGLPRKTRGYRLELMDGLAKLPNDLGRIRFDGSINLSSEREWHEFKLVLSLRALSCELTGLAAEQTLRVKATNDATQFERTFKFSELQNPPALIGEFAGPFAGGLVREMGWPVNVSTASTASNPAAGWGLKWESSSDVIQVGHTSIRVYKLRTRLIDRYEIKVIISRIGEILRVDLPDNVVMVNEESGLSPKLRYD